MKLFQDGQHRDADWAAAAGITAPPRPVVTRMAIAEIENTDVMPTASATADDAVPATPKLRDFTTPTGQATSITAVSPPLAEDAAGMASPAVSMPSALQASGLATVAGIVPFQIVTPAMAVAAGTTAKTSPPASSAVLTSAIPSLPVQPELTSDLEMLAFIQARIDDTRGGVTPVERSVAPASRLSSRQEAINTALVPPSTAVVPAGGAPGPYAAPLPLTTQSTVASARTTHADQWTAPAVFGQPDAATAAATSTDALPAVAAIALDLQPKGTTFGNGGDETTAMTLGNTGAGITVGILSDSFDTSGNADTTATDIADGYLPQNTNVEIEGSSGGTDEGRAMAQVVHEVAPGANILFATADSTQQDFANNILTLANDGAKVIVDDYLYYAEPDYQDGVIAQAIEKVESEGVVYLTSAQNDGSQGYEGAFVPGNTFTFDGQSFTADDFSPGDPLLQIKTGEFGAVVNLEWETPAASASNAATGGTSGPGVSSDLALFLVNAAGQIVGGISDENSVGDNSVLGADPIQQVVVEEGGQTDYLEVGLLAGSMAPADLKITADDDAGQVTLGAVASNIDDGTMSGHAGAPGVIAVGAANYGDTPAYGSTQPVNEAFSSAGPITIGYADDGQPLVTPRVATVAATGVDGVITSFFGEYGTDDQGNKGHFFYGTSAAAPSLAGVAALMLQENSGLTPSDVKNLLQDAATAQPTVNSAGAADPNVGGAGLVDGQVAIELSQLINNQLVIDAHGTVLGTHFNDRLTLDSDTGTMTGGSGADTYVITTSDAGYALGGGTPDAITNYDQGGTGSYVESEGDSVDLTGPYASYATAGEGTDSFARVLTVLGTGVGQVQVMAGSGWTTVADLDGVHYQDPVAAAVQQAGAVSVLLSMTTVATPTDLNTVAVDFSAATATDGRFLVNITTGGLSSNTSFTLPGLVTFQTDVGTTTLNGALSPSDDNGSLVKTGAGTLVLGNSGGHYEGGTTITGGVLELAAQAVGEGTNFTSGVIGFGAITFAPASGATATLKLDAAAQQLGYGHFLNQLNAFGNGDQIDLTGYAYTPSITQVIYSAAQHTLVVDELVSTGDQAGVDQDQLQFQLENETPGLLGQFFASSDSDGGTIIDNGIACFLPGSAILTPDGEVPVERLRAGMAVSVLEQGRLVARPVRWVGQGRSDRAAADALDRHPVRIRAGAIRDGVPRRDLLVTAEHCILLDGGLIPARMLVNGASIVADTAIAGFDYFHIELEQHGILLAEGLETESYLDTGNRLNFHNAGVTVLRPRFDTDPGHAAWATDTTAPLVTDRAAVEPIWRRLAARGAGMGWATVVEAAVRTDDPALQLELADGKVLEPCQRLDGRWTFRIPCGARAVRLLSRSARPSESMGPFVDDRRRLGVAVEKLVLWQGLDDDVIPAAVLALPGWHALEGSRRWTNGAAALDLPAAGEATLLDVHVGATTLYALPAAAPGRLRNAA